MSLLNYGSDDGYEADTLRRIDKVQSFEDKVAAVNKLLGKE